MKKSAALLFLTLISQLILAQGLCETVKSLPIPYTQDLPSQYFGHSVAVDGDYAIVGAPGHNNTGIAIVLYYNGSSWVHQAQLSTNEVNVTDFGRSVGISGDHIVIGTSSGQAYVFSKPAGGWSDTTETAKLVSDDWESTDGFGYAVSISSGIVVVGAPSDKDHGSNTGATYLFSQPASGWSGTINQTVKLLASDASGSDRFGKAVSISGDNIVIGAPTVNISSLSYGAAYVFTKAPSGWENTAQSAVLLPSNRSVNGEFGSAVSISGDNVVVGQHGEFIGAGSVGGAYVYTKPVSGWSDMTETGKLTASNGESLDHFGWSVAISGDHVFVGAYLGDDWGNGTGSGYVFTKPPAGWNNMVQTAQVYGSDGVVWDHFGWSAGFSGDKLLVGALNVDDKAIDVGAVYSFIKPVGAWTSTVHTQKIISSASYTGNISDQYGKSVAIDGNYAVVGSPGFNSSAGKAYVLEYSNSTWTTIASLLPSDGASSDNFGEGVSMSGDHIVVGATNNSVFGTSSGSAYVFTKPASGWADMTETAKIYSSDREGGDKFGCSVGISGKTVVIGANQDDDGGSNAGAAYVFVEPTSGWSTMIQTCKITASDAIYSNYFGTSVGVDNDDIVVGAFGDWDSGSAYIYTKPIGGWVNMTETARILPSDGTQNDNFGISVAISGETVVIGENGYNPKDRWSAYNGSAYVFIKPASGWVNATQTAKLQPSNRNSLDKFGSAVSVNGDSVLIGAYGDRSNGLVPGAAYLFTKPVSGWVDTVQTLILPADESASAVDFGYAVGISNGHIISGTYNSAEQGISSGSAYFYDSCTAVYTVNNLGDSLIANQQNATYKWLDCNNSDTVIVGATDQTYVPTTTGSYAVEVTYGTNLDTSACQSIIILGTRDNSIMSSVNLYPNPTNDIVNIGLGDLTDVEVKVFNSLGQLVHLAQNVDASVYNFTLDKKKGLFLVEIRSAAQVKYLKLLSH